MDLARRGKRITLKLATSEDSVNVLLDPSEAWMIGEALREYAEGA
jgi:hypothetical protein